MLSFVGAIDGMMRGLRSSASFPLHGGLAGSRDTAILDSRDLSSTRAGPDA
jgi:hypothetical protein